MEVDLDVMSLGEDNLAISRILVDWYHIHKRELPWRETEDPYIIWISEIILQQTRVTQGMDYFLRFVTRFPQVSDLAQASEDEVLKYWQGLGYYSRARNLHAAAKEIMNRFNGVFPCTYTDVLSLKGVGEYTVAAILSFAWNQPYPVVDGNVFRVLSRLFALDIPIDTTKGKKQFTHLAGLLMNPSEARSHNQAVMEFGALQCIPQNPDCSICPLMTQCMAFQNAEVQSYPVKQHKTKTRNRYFHYFHILYKDRTWLYRRKGKDIWTGLYEFPLIETAHRMDFSDLQQTEEFQKLFATAGRLVVSIERPKEKHVLSHQIIYAVFYRIEIEQMSEALQTYLEIPSEEIEKYAVPRLIHIYLEKSGINLAE
ncbi:A/G-specific adenine glycosylase [Parabacteroides sp. PM5-20]|uniref:A/G-specific adenine glycosylase n=1 Tax=unclassified Parabacteroides TaxID=2649774 RepID=UPI001EF3C1D7|nr:MULTISPECIES: A/G-specific adenine glycosylase [unclassified Parabacteroides]MDH6535563.1 A/G-specific adenine glycosylase [Parabacteroides sp. PM5-20]